MSIGEKHIRKVLYQRNIWNLRLKKLLKKRKEILCTTYLFHSQLIGRIFVVYVDVSSMCWYIELNLINEMKLKVVHDCFDHVSFFLSKNLLLPLACKMNAILFTISFRIFLSPSRNYTECSIRKPCLLGPNLNEVGVFHNIYHKKYNRSIIFASHTIKSNLFFIWTQLFMLSLHAHMKKEMKDD